MRRFIALLLSAVLLIFCSGCNVNTQHSAESAGPGTTAETSKPMRSRSMKLAACLAMTIL